MRSKYVVAEWDTISSNFNRIRLITVSAPQQLDVIRKQQLNIILNSDVPTQRMRAFQIQLAMHSPSFQRSKTRGNVCRNFWIMIYTTYLIQLDLLTLTARLMGISNKLCA
jgi:hypothetical protein